MSPWLHFANSLLHVWNKAGSTQRHPLMLQSRRTAISHSKPRLQFKTRICLRKRTFIWTSRLQRCGNAFVLNKHSRWWFSIYMEKYYSAGYFLYQNASVIEFYLPFGMTILTFFTLWINCMLFAGFHNEDICSAGIFTHPPAHQSSGSSLGSMSRTRCSTRLQSQTGTRSLSTRRSSFTYHPSLFSRK